jgi:predicted Zn-dependent protease with MMP-like domain
MQEITDERFQELIDEALGELPKRSLDHLKNVAILFEAEPTEEQRIKSQLQPYQSLYGLYEGVPLAFRQGQQPVLPDRITLFKLPMLASSADDAALKEQIKHTLWHEIAHYYGLNHDQIHEKE